MRKKPRGNTYLLTSPRHLIPYREKMEQILLAYSLLKENVAAIMMLYKNTKVRVHSLNGDIDYFDIVLQGGTLAPYLFIICLDYELRMSKNLMKMVSSWQRKEAEDTLPKLLWMQTMLMT